MAIKKQKKSKKLAKSNKPKPKVVQKPTKKANPPVPKTGGKNNKAKDFEMRADRLTVKGKERGFVTYDEILKEFPQIEQDIVFLDELYVRFATRGIDVLE